MHRNVIVTFGLIVYFVVVTSALINFDFGLVASTLLLLGLPTYFLSHFSYAPMPVIVAVSCFGIGLGFLLESIAHLFNLWSLNTTIGFLVPGVISFEIAVLVVLKILFLTLFYELLFDDGEYSIAQARSRVTEFILFAVGAVILTGFAYAATNGFAYPAGYYWITIFLFLAGVAMVAVRQPLTTRLFNKIGIFVAAAIIPLLCIEVVVLTHDYRVFGEILHPIAIPFTAVTVPLGEILLLMAMPAFVATVYELYLDDRE